MDVRLGVLNHTVLSYKTRERNQDKKLRNIEAEEFDDLIWASSFWYPWSLKFIKVIRLNYFCYFKNKSETWKLIFNKKV